MASTVASSNSLPSSHTMLLSPPSLFFFFNVC
jgi:hypothetical protein